MTGPSSVYQNASYYYSVNLPLNVTGSKTWIVPAGWAVTAGQGTIQATIRTGTNGGTVTCRITECGITRDLFKNVTTDGGGTPLRTDAATLDSMGFMNVQNTRSSIRVWPNPAYREILVTYHANKEHKGNGIKHIRISDITGATKKEFRYSDSYIQRKLQVDGLSMGIYFVSVLTTEGWFNEKIIVQ